MILQSSSKKMGIDWHLAYEELRRITHMMKLGLAKSKKKKKRAKGLYTFSVLQRERQRQRDDCIKKKKVYHYSWSFMAQ